MVIKYTETPLGNGKYFSDNLLGKSRSGFINTKDFQRPANCFPLPFHRKFLLTCWTMTIWMKLLISRQLKITVLGAVKFSAECAFMVKSSQLAGVISHRHFQLMQEQKRWLCLHPDSHHLCLGCTSLTKHKVIQQFQFRIWSNQNWPKRKEKREGWMRN